MNIQLKRAYDRPSQTDGKRILVDSIWPRGLSREKAKIDLWLKDIAPSKELRKWFGHDPNKWQGFQSSYFQELKNKLEQVNALIELIKQGPVTLVYAAKDTKYNNAVALKIFLQSMVDQI